MKKKIVFLLFVLTPMAADAQSDVIPKPAEIVRTQGNFSWTGGVKIYNGLGGEDGERMDRYLETLTFDWSETAADDRHGVIRLLGAKLRDSDPEAYEMRVGTDAVEIRGNTGAGVFYGMQTLLQSIETGDLDDCSIPCMTVRDSPRYAYRGYMLDVSRHFFAKEDVMRLLDKLARYKINKFHFHLVDDGGWRVQIDKYPLLTEKGAWRETRDYEWSKWDYCEQTPLAYGGYYTRDDIREIVRHAAMLHIEVIPEIDLPGHSPEVLFSYPELSCRGSDYRTSSELCIGKEKTFEFCESVLTEIMDLFPSKYIHIGGDECSTDSWSRCADCKRCMTENGINDLSEYQGYFTRRIVRFLATRGKTAIGWNEILGVALPKDVVIMTWQTRKDCAETSTKQGHPVLYTPTSNCYLDYWQDNPCTQPASMFYCPLDSCYALEPDDFGAGNGPETLGVQGNLWTEHVPTLRHLEYMTFPRMLAIAEAGWTAKPLRDWTDFRRRALLEVDELSMEGVHPFPLKYEYGHRPESLQPVDHLGRGKKVADVVPDAPGDTEGAETSLADGLLGDWMLDSDRWRIFDDEMDVVIDLGILQDIHSIGATFARQAGGSYWLPKEIEIAVSGDRASWHTIYHKSFPVIYDFSYGLFDYVWNGSAQARYVRFHAFREKAWGVMACDEIIIK